MNLSFVSASFIETYANQNNQFGTNEHFYFDYNLIEGTADRPENVDQKITTDVNVGISGNIGSLQQGAYTLTEVTDVFFVKNKSGLGDLSISVVDGTAPNGAKISDIIGLSNSNITVAQGEKASISLKITVTSLQAKGDYSGFIKVQDSQSAEDHQFLIDLKVY